MTRERTPGIGRAASPLAAVGGSSGQYARSLEIDEDVAAGYVRLLGRSGQLAFELDRLRSRGIWIVTIADDDYPAVLRERLER